MSDSFSPLNEAQPQATLTPSEQLAILKRQYWQQVLMLMVPSQSITPAVGHLLLTLLAVFLLTTFPTFNEPQHWALEWGLLYGPWVAQGEWWRVITGQLMHANWLHIGSNGFGIWVFGRQVEPLFGQKGMWGLYGVCALLTAVFTLWLEHQASIGASGITYGVLGCNVMLVFLVRQQLNQQGALKDAFGLLLLSIAYVGMNVTTAQLNVWGHLGGFLGGLVVGTWQFNKLQQAIRRLAIPVIETP